MSLARLAESIKRIASGLRDVLTEEKLLRESAAFSEMKGVGLTAGSTVGRCCRACDNESCALLAR